MDINIFELKHSLESFDQVLEAKVIRIFPDALRVELNEEVPMFKLKMQSSEGVNFLRPNSAGRWPEKPPGCNKMHLLRCMLNFRKSISESLPLQKWLLRGSKNAVAVIMSKASRNEVETSLLIELQCF